MTNLTEQLATESLPEYTEFYVRKKDGSTDTQTWLNRRHSSAVEWWNTFNITEVLAKVPSYEEYQKLLSDQLAKNEGAEINAELEERLKKTQELELDLRRENRKFKELLKDCKPFVELCNYTPENKRLLEQIVEQIGDK